MQTKNEYIASVLRAHQANLLKALNAFDFGPVDPILDEMQKSLGNVAAELVKLPSPAMAKGAPKRPSIATPNSTVVSPIPKPKKPSPAMAA